MQTNQTPGELLPCPFCGSADVQLHEFDADTGPWYVDCHGCAMQTPNAEYRHEAIEAWNTRAQPTRDEEVKAVARAIAHARSWQTEALTVGDWDDRSKHERAPFLEMARAALAAMQRPLQTVWQPIETAPKDGTRLLLRHGDHVFAGSWREFLRDDYRWLSDGNNVPVRYPTDWQPLPEPPAMTAARVEGE